VLISSRLDEDFSGWHDSPTVQRRCRSAEARRNFFDLRAVEHGGGTQRGRSADRVVMVGHSSWLSTSTFLAFYPGFALQPGNNTIQFIHQRWLLSRGAAGIRQATVVADNT
jgi:hypothetical protein